MRAAAAALMGRGRAGGLGDDDDGDNSAELHQQMEQIVKLEKELAATETGLKDSKTQLRRALSELIEGREKISVLEKTTKAQHDELKDLKDKNSFLSKILDKAETQLDLTGNTERDATAQKFQKEQLIEEFKAFRAKAAEEDTRLREHMRRLLENMATRAASDEAAKAALREEVRELRSQLSGLKQQLGVSNQKVSEAEEAADDMRARLENTLEEAELIKERASEAQADAVAALQNAIDSGGDIVVPEHLMPANMAATAAATAAAAAEDPNASMSQALITTTGAVPQQGVDAGGGHHRHGHHGHHAPTEPEITAEQVAATWMPVAKLVVGGPEALREHDFDSWGEEGHDAELQSRTISSFAPSSTSLMRPETCDEVIKCIANNRTGVCLIKGDAGAGKSYLIACITHALPRRVHGSKVLPTLTCASWASTDIRRLLRNLALRIREVIVNLKRPDGTRVVPEKDGHGKWTLPTLGHDKEALCGGIEIMLGLVARCGEKLVLLIDGADEMESNVGRYTLMEWLPEACVNTCHLVISMRSGHASSRLEGRTKLLTSVHLSDTTLAQRELLIQHMVKDRRRELRAAMAADQEERRLEKLAAWQAKQFEREQRKLARDHMKRLRPQDLKRKEVPEELRPPRAGSDGLAPDVELPDNIDDLMNRYELECLMDKDDAKYPLYIITAISIVQRPDRTTSIVEAVEALPGTLPELCEWVLKDLEKRHGASLMQTVLGLLGASRAGMSQVELLLLTKRLLVKRGDVAALQQLAGVEGLEVWSKIMFDLRIVLRSKQPKDLSRLDGVPGQHGGLLTFKHAVFKAEVGKRYLSHTCIWHPDSSLVDVHGTFIEHFRWMLEQGDDNGTHPLKRRAALDSRLPSTGMSGPIDTRVELPTVETLDETGEPEVHDIVPKPPPELNKFAAMLAETSTPGIQSTIRREDKDLAIIPGVDGIGSPSGVVGGGAPVKAIDNAEVVDAPPSTIGLPPSEIKRLALVNEAWEGEARWQWYHANRDLLWHHLAFSDWKGVEEVLTELWLLEHHVRTLMPHDSDADFAAALEAAALATLRDPDMNGGGGAFNFKQWNRVSDFRRFISENTYVLTNFPEVAQQQASNQPDSTPVAVTAALTVDNGLVKRPWFQLLNKSQLGDPLLLQLGHPGTVNSVAFAPDGRRIATACSDGFGGRLAVWDGRNGRLLQSMTQFSTNLVYTAFSGDGTMLLAQALDGLVAVYDCRNWKERLRGQIGETDVSCSVFAADGIKIFLGHRSGKVACWEGQSGVKFYRMFEVYNVDEQGGSSAVTSIVLNTDSTRVMIGLSDGICKIYHFNQLEGLYFALALKKHTSTIVAVAITGDGRVGASTAFDLVVKVWDCVTERDGPLLSLKPPVECHALAFSADGHFLTTGLKNGGIMLWSVSATGSSAEPGSALMTFPLRHSRHISTLSMSSNGKFVVSGSADCQASVWSVMQGLSGEAFAGHKGASVTAVAFSKDASEVVTAASNGSMKMWSSKSGVEIVTLEGHPDAVSAVAFDLCNPIVVSLSTLDGTMRWWNGLTGSESIDRRVREHFTTCVHVHPAGKYMAAGAADGIVCVFEVATGERLYQLGVVSEVKKLERVETQVGGHDDEVTSLRFHPTESLIVTASADKTLKVWSTVHHGLLNTLSGHNGTVNGVDFAVPNSRPLMISGSADGTAFLWETQDWKRVGIIRTHEGPVTAVAFGMQGPNVFTGSTDGSIRAWRITCTTRVNDVNALTPNDVIVEPTAVFWSPSPVRCLAPAPSYEDEELAVGADDGRLFLIRLVLPMKDQQPTLQQGQVAAGTNDPAGGVALDGKAPATTAVATTSGTDGAMGSPNKVP